APGWRLRVDSEGLAVLTMPTWALYTTTWDWKASLRTTFETLVDRGVTDLVIDLRENEGGLGVGDEILAHLVDAPFALDDLERRVRYRQVPARLNPYLDTWDDGFRNWGMNAQPIDDRFFRQLLPADRRRGDVVRPVAPRFTGRVFVLVSPVNGSATYEFALTARRRGLATLVGGPLGGNERGINGGAFFFLRLPGSGLEVDLPAIGYFRPGEAPDAAPRPDVIAAPTVESIAAGVDPALEAVERLRSVTPPGAGSGERRTPSPAPPR
ncbi:MAG: S41 family peptidase, partial [Anaeromyxobacteraceae bacterium]